MLLDYLATHPDAKVRFYATDMHLYLESDAAYLVLPRARSRCAVYYYLGDRLQSSTDKPAINGAVHVLCKTTPNVVSSSAEAKTAGSSGPRIPPTSGLNLYLAKEHPMHQLQILLTNTLTKKIPK